MKRLAPLLCSAVLLVTNAAFAAAQVNPVASAPASAAVPVAPTAAAAEDDKEGTTVMGDRESPIGLLIAPWREAAPEKDLDRPVRLLEDELIPLDAEVFRRQLEYYRTISSHLRSRGVPGYVDPVTVSPLAASTAPVAPISPTAPPAAQ